MAVTVSGFIFVPIQSPFMAKVPDTSTTLLRDVAGSMDNPRWGEFVARYRPVLEAFMFERFPSLDAGELIQETFIAIARVLPNYRYVPEEKGHFHNFLTGILHHKALGGRKRTTGNANGEKQSMR